MTRDAASSAASFAVDYELLAAELILSLRGRQSQAAFSRRLGYKSNIVSRWEARKAFPTAGRFLEIVARVQPYESLWLRRFFGRVPPALARLNPASSEAAAAFLRELRGKVAILSVARASGFNRYSVSRWFEGHAEPRLPQFLQLIEVMSRRLLDFLAACSDPAKMSSVAAAWRRLELTREVAYSVPWSHGVLRALELKYDGMQHQKAWLAERLGLSVQEVSKALSALEQTGQIKKVRGKWRLKHVVSVNTSQNPERAHALKIAWTQTALERMRAGAPGNYGYSLFAISKQDLRRLRELHLEYVRAMQNVIAASEPGECVALYCAELLDLAASQNALAD